MCKKTLEVLAKLMSGKVEVDQKPIVEERLWTNRREDLSYCNFRIVFDNGLQTSVGKRSVVVVETILDVCDKVIILHVCM